MSLTTQDIHIFLHNNLPEYERKDVIAILKFYLQQRNISDKKPIKTAIARWNDFKNFIARDWQGEEIDHARHQKTAPHKPPQPLYGRCNCGGEYVLRTNNKSLENFLGCSNYPKCRNTMPL